MTSFLEKYKSIKGNDDTLASHTDNQSQSSFGDKPDSKSIESFITNAKSGNRFISLPVDSFIPDPLQPRKAFDTSEIDRLRLDIEEIGQLQPIVVKPLMNGTHEIIVGERRWRAVSASKKLKTLDAVIAEDTIDELTILRMQIQENSNRIGVSVLEEAAALLRGVELSKQIDPKADDKTVAKTLGISSSKVSKSRAILNSPDFIKGLCHEGIINDYASLYDLSRAYKKHPDETKELTIKIKDGLIDNIRSSIKNISSHEKVEPFIDSVDIDESEIINTEEEGSYEKTEHANDQLEGENQKGTPPKKEGQASDESSQKNNSIESEEFSSTIVEDIDFKISDSSNLMTLHTKNKAFEFELADDAIDVISMFVR